MNTAILVKNGELCGYPGDLLINGEVIKSYNLEFECKVNNIKLLIGKYLPGELIKALRESGVMFLKIKSLEELEGLDMDISFPEEFNKKRGWGCSGGFNVS
ncbi:hypothetical protein [Nautilia sp.]